MQIEHSADCAAGSTPWGVPINETFMGQNFQRTGNNRSSDQLRDYSHSPVCVQGTTPLCLANGALCHALTPHLLALVIGRHLGMFKQEYTPRQRGSDEHMGYYQGCGSAWTHVASCCSGAFYSLDADVPVAAVPQVVQTTAIKTTCVLEENTAVMSGLRVALLPIKTDQRPIKQPTRQTQSI